MLCSFIKNLKDSFKAKQDYEHKILIKHTNLLLMVLRKNIYIDLADEFEYGYGILTCYNHKIVEYLDMILDELIVTNATLKFDANSAEVIDGITLVLETYSCTEAYHRQKSKEKLNSQRKVLERLV